MMVGSFKHKGLEEIYRTGKTQRIRADFARKCIRILQSMEAATRPSEMDVTGYRFHSLHGDPPRWSVRVSRNYRISFGWSGEGAEDVDFEDYH